MSIKGHCQGFGEQTIFRHLMPIIPKLQRQGGLTMQYRDIQLSDYYQKPWGIAYRENLMKYFPNQEFKRDVYPYLLKHHEYSEIPKNIIFEMKSDIVSELKYRDNFIKKRINARYMLIVASITIACSLIGKWFVISIREKERMKNKYFLRLEHTAEIYEELPNIKRLRQAQVDFLKRDDE